MAIKEIPVAIYKFVMSQLAKKSGKTGITTIPKAGGLNVELTAKQIQKTLESMGLDVSKIKSTKEVQKYLNIHESWMKQQVKKGPKVTDDELRKGIKKSLKDVEMIEVPKMSVEELTEGLIKDIPEWTKGWTPTVIKGGKGKDTVRDITNRLEESTKKIEDILREEKKLKDWKPTSEAFLKQKHEGLNKKTIERIKRRRYEAALKAEREKMAKDPEYIPEILDPEDFAGGGLAGMLGERTGYQWGKRAYKSREDIPKNVLAMLEKDPNFDLETFLKDVEWSHPDQTALQLQLKGEADDLSSWGHYDDRTGKVSLNYQKFGKGEPIAGGLLSYKKPTDADKVQTILHELRHKKFAEPWFRKSSAVPKYVREHKGSLYSDEDDRGRLIDTPYKETYGEELYNRFLDKRYGVVAEKGTLTGSDYKPYVDKILRDHWEPYAKAYEDIIREEKRVKSKPHGLAGGGLAGMLGEPTYSDGGRIGFDKGKKVDLSKRKFLKGAGAGLGLLSMLPFVGKFFKPAAKLIKTKSLTSVPIGNAPGMPDWYWDLVNKVIKEGDDITQKAATQERHIVHRAEIDKNRTVDVTQDLNTGNVRVQYNTPNSMGEYGVDLNYKAAEIVEDASRKAGKEIKTKPEFSAVEAEPRVVDWEGTIEWDGENVVGKVDDLWTDTNALKEYATGKVSSAKELHKSIKKQRYVNKLKDDVGEQVDYIENKTGHMAPEHLMDEPLPDDYPFASGGRVPLAGGKLALKLFAKLKKEYPTINRFVLREISEMNPEQQSKAMKELIEYVGNVKKRQQIKQLEAFGIEGKIPHASGGRVSLSAGGLAGMLGE